MSCHMTIVKVEVSGSFFYIAALAVEFHACALLCTLSSGVSWKQPFVADENSL